MRFLINHPSPAVTRLIETKNVAERDLSFYHNRDYHCPQCGALWARWQLEDVDDVEYYPYRRSCFKHSRGVWTGDMPGSLLLTNNDIMIVPREILEYEFNLLYNYHNPGKVEDELRTA